MKNKLWNVISFICAIIFTICLTISAVYITPIISKMCMLQFGADIGSIVMAIIGYAFIMMVIFSIRVIIEISHSIWR